MDRYADWSATTKFEPTRNLMSKAFASGEPVVDWITSKSNLPLAKRAEAYKFVMSFPIQDGLSRGGLTFGKPKEESEHSELECGILFREYDPEKEPTLSEELCTAGKQLETYAELDSAGGIPEPFNLGLLSKPTRSYFQRGILYDKLSKSFHKTYGPKGLHWYITAVGVDPECQGKGHGKTLMGQMGNLADEVGMDVYLECAGTKNKGFYEKMGFEEVGIEKVWDGSDEDDAATVHLMIRPHQ